MELIETKENPIINNYKQAKINKYNKMLFFEEKLSRESNINSDDINIDSKYLEQNLNINSNNEQEFISILDKKYGLIHKIGEGSTAKVYLGYNLNNENIEKNYYSIKIYKSEKFNMEMYNNEANLLKSISHENVLHIYDYGKGKKIKSNGKIKEVYYIVMEYMEHGDLLKYITNISSKKGENIGFGEEYARLIFSILLEGLEAMHNSDIVHRDIKPDNIMIGNDYKMKIVDLGFATRKSHKLLKKYLGTPSYAAPEIHIRKPYLGQYSDIFSLGVTLFVLVTGSLPFRLPVPNDILYQFFVRNDYIGFWRQRKVRVSVSFMELFDNLVAFDFTQRPSISEIKKSKWMKEANYSLMPKLIEELKRREFIINEKLKKELNNNKGNNQMTEIKRVKKDEEIYNCQKYLKSINIKNNENNIKKYNTEINKENDDLKKESIDIEEDFMKLSSISSIKSKNNEKIKENSEIKYGIYIMVENHNLNTIMTEICKYLNNKGFKNVVKNMKELNIFINDDKLEVVLHFQNYKKKNIKISYTKNRGSKKDFAQFKKIIKGLKFKIQK